VHYILPIFRITEHFFRSHIRRSCRVRSLSQNIVYFSCQPVKVWIFRTSSITTIFSRNIPQHDISTQCTLGFHFFSPNSGFACRLSLAQVDVYPLYEHCAYGHSVATLLNPRGVTIVSHKHSPIAARHATVVVVVPSTVHYPSNYETNIYYSRQSLKMLINSSR
jgi:hypothetical protein